MFVTNFILELLMKNPSKNSQSHRKIVTRGIDYNKNLEEYIPFDADFREE